MGSTVELLQKIGMIADVVGKFIPTGWVGTLFHAGAELLKKIAGDVNEVTPPTVEVTPNLISRCIAAIVKAEKIGVDAGLSNVEIEIPWTDGKVKVNIKYFIASFIVCSSTLDEGALVKSDDLLHVLSAVVDAGRALHDSSQ